MADARKKPDRYHALVTARRARLRAWIEERHEGSQSAFILSTGINQGELSGLLGSKSFGEAKALAIEDQAGMPQDYLHNPMEKKSKRKGAAEPINVPDTLDRHDGDILFLRTVLNAALASLARSIPAAAHEVRSSLEGLDGHESGYLRDAIATIKEAQASAANATLSGLRPSTFVTAKKTGKQ